MKMILPIFKWMIFSLSPLAYSAKSKRDNGWGLKKEILRAKAREIIIFSQEVAKLVSLCEASDTSFTQAVICSHRDEFAFLF